MAYEGCIFGMGNPLLDIIVPVDMAYLSKYDLRSDDAILAETKHMAIFDEISLREDAEYLPGGATLNAIKVAAWVLCKRDSTSFASCIAADKCGKILEKSCTKLGVHPILQYTTSGQLTGTCAVLIHKHDRSLVTRLGAVNKFTVDHLDDPGVWKWVQKARVVYIGGFFLPVCPPAVMRVAKQALENGAVFSMNLSASFVCKSFCGDLLEAMPYVDLLFGNADEAQALADVQNWKCTSVLGIAKRVSEMPMADSKKGRTVVITQGVGPVILVRNGTVTEYPVELLKKEQIVDTNGAGDAFVGGFLAQLVQGKSFEDAVRCGMYASRVVVQRSGCTTPAVCTFT